jgi:hypothetical protein
MILLLGPPEWWDYTCIPLHLAADVFGKEVSFTNYGYLLTLKHMLFQERQDKVLIFAF